MGSVDQPFNPISLALGAEASFVARTLDSDRKHLTEVLRAAVAHRGASLVEIYQNCPIFNDGALRVAPVAEVGLDAVLVHDATAADPSVQFALSRLGDPSMAHVPVGVFRSVRRAVYDDRVREQVAVAAAGGPPSRADLGALLAGNDSWTVWAAPPDSATQ
jgi:2-oxoglutarate/2-oxoacid ferredoxin oxidoreductase subunit beta